VNKSRGLQFVIVALMVIGAVTLIVIAPLNPVGWIILPVAALMGWSTWDDIRHQKKIDSIMAETDREVARIRQARIQAIDDEAARCRAYFDGVIANLKDKSS
jgi:hypothetical protein